jgi:hypothetical protein
MIRGHSYLATWDEQRLWYHDAMLLVYVCDSAIRGKGDPGYALLYNLVPSRRVMP